MGERDAFGREKGEDPLEDLGWKTGGAANRTSGLAVPVPVPRKEVHGAADVNHEGIPGTHAPAASTFSDREPSGSGLPGGFGTGAPGGLPGAQIDLRGLRIFGRLVRGLVLLGILAAVLVGGGGALVDKIGDEIDKLDDTVNSTPASPVVPATPEAEQGAAPAEGEGSRSEEERAAGESSTPVPDRPPVGLGRGSLLLRTNFAAVLRRMRNGGYGRLTNLRVAPERIDAQFVTSGGRLRSVQFQPGGTVRDLGMSGGGFSGMRTMSIADIDASAPARATASAAGRLRRPASQVNYLVYTEVFAGQPWGVYFKAGQYFRADRRGAITRRFS